ncbi:phage head closure protein [Sulfitobacter guttiformis]|uniref:SPP1 family predicted phage head-tail adaptor n=1 Tax=Sulfitobacter guttiformis TaxID=74349 RepID=A0A420DIR2_9RHOB|nr:phage head closure protein [Sulfitobacter guttiformis]KIN72102.1 putative phage head-tail adaptor [Sulfitobacter guttiformis KCTC 32187]RKE94120.1 SPP1 family predicted phage head-tail adaptor [Sulfitobacter guttiformis]
MSAPRLNRQLVLEAPDVLSDGSGGYVQGWVPLGTVWAQVTPRSGRETAQSGAPVSRMGFRVIVRGAPSGSTKRPAAQQRFRDGDRIFTIEAVAEHDPDGRYLACAVQEEQVV